MPKRLLGIKWKLFFYLLCFCLLLILILALFQTVFLDRFYTAIKQAQVQQTISAVSESVIAENWDAIQTQTEENEIFIEVWNEQGKQVASSGVQIGDIHPQMPPEGIQTLFESLADAGGSITHHTKGPDGVRRMNESIISLRLATTPGGSRYVVLASAMLSPVNATVETLRVQLYCISAIMLVLSVALALLISRKISKPIVSISRTAGELGRGNYNIVFRGNGYREVGQLADALTDAAAELSRTEELRRELIANVSHDLRTPLTLIAGYSEMIRDIPEEATPENLQVIIDETNRLTELVNDLLDLSKLQSGVEKLRIAPFDLAALAGDIHERMARFYEKDGYDFRFERPGGPVLVRGDEQRIAQVLYNFMLNAVLHTGEDKRVSQRLSVSGGRARLEVTDTGKGIAPENQAYIWERYYKVDVHRGRPSSGTGLGLSIVRSVLEQHPGVAYGVQSQPGQGSTFWFEIPLSKDPSA